MSPRLDSRWGGSSLSGAGVSPAGSAGFNLAHQRRKQMSGPSMKLVAARPTPSSSQSSARCLEGKRAQWSNPSTPGSFAQPPGVLKDRFLATPATQAAPKNGLIWYERRARSIRRRLSDVVNPLCLDGQAGRHNLAQGLAAIPSVERS